MNLKNRSIKSMHCCADDHVIKADPKNKQQRKALFYVLWINIVMCLITLIGGWIAHSSAILADSVDFISHVFLIAFSLFAAHKGTKWIAKASLIKGVTMLFIGGSVLIDAIKEISSSQIPEAHTIGIIGSIAITANMISMYFLRKNKNDDINMKSSWLCSRNDLVTHLAIILTSFLVHWTGSKWPDTVVGILLALMIMDSGLHVIRFSLKILQANSNKPRDLRHHKIHST